MYNYDNMPFDSMPLNLHITYNYVHVYTYIIICNEQLFRHKTLTVCHLKSFPVLFTSLESKNLWTKKVYCSYMYLSQHACTPHLSLSTQFVDALSKIWCYYEAFLGQTQMLNADPIRELANSFTNLKVSVWHCSNF